MALLHTQGPTGPPFWKRFTDGLFRKRVPLPSVKRPPALSGNLFPYRGTRLNVNL